MAVTKTTRLGLTRWSAGTDPLTRAQLDDGNASLEAQAVIFAPEGTLTNRPAPAKAGRLYRVTDAAANKPTVFYDTGSAWVELRPDLAGYATTTALTNGLAGKVDTTDSRLTDARTPTAHTHTKSQITDFAHTHAIADLPVASSGTSSSTLLVRADDARLSDTRVPRSHTHAIADLPVATAGETSATLLVRADDARLSNARTPVAHTHAITDLPVAAAGQASSTLLVRSDDPRLNGSISDAGLPARLKSAAQSAATVGSANDAVESGFFYVGGSSTPRPDGVNDFLLEVTAYNSSFVSQTAYGFNQATTHRRDRVSGTWGAWRPLVYGDDSRLSDARTPVAHTHDDRYYTEAETDARHAAIVHTHTKSQITDFAHTHAIADLPVAASGTSSSTSLVRADDSRLSDARTPVAHTHDDRYYTEGEADARYGIRGQANDYVGLQRATTDTGADTAATASYMATNPTGHPRYAFATGSETHQLRFNRTTKRFQLANTAGDSLMPLDVSDLTVSGQANVGLLNVGGSAAVTTNDSRLTDARTPKAHTHGINDLPVAASGASSTTSLVRADDSRLTDARTPTAHTHGINDLPVAPSGTSSSTALVRADDARLADARTPKAHDHDDRYYTENEVLNLLSTLVPSGMLMDGGRSDTPPGWLLCDGSAVSRTTYSALYAAIGSTWGPGDGSSTFNLPDLRDRERIGAGARALGVTDGLSQTSRLNTRFHDHSHGHNIYSTEAGSHAHSVSGSNTAVGDHSHTAAGTTTTNGDHAHSLSNADRTAVPAGTGGGSRIQSGNTTTDGAHNHGFSAVTSGSGSHNHSWSGSVDASGSHSHGIGGGVYSSSSQEHAFAVVRVFIKT